MLDYRSCPRLCWERYVTWHRYCLDAVYRHWYHLFNIQTVWFLKHICPPSFRYSITIFKYLQRWIFTKEDKCNQSFGLSPRWDGTPSRTSPTGGKDRCLNRASKYNPIWQTYKGAKCPGSRDCSQALGRFHWADASKLALRDDGDFPLLRVDLYPMTSPARFLSRAFS